MIFIMNDIKANFVQDLGWINDEEKKMILDNHLKELELAAQYTNDTNPNDADQNFGIKQQAASHVRKKIN